MINTFIVILVIDSVSFSLIIKMLVSPSDEICFIYFRKVMFVNVLDTPENDPANSGRKRKEVMEKSH
jgi:hypothetical protein